MICKNKGLVAFVREGGTNSERRGVETTRKQRRLERRGEGGSNDQEEKDETQRKDDKFPEKQQISEEENVPGLKTASNI